MYFQNVWVSIFLPQPIFGSLKYTISPAPKFQTHSSNEAIWKAGLQIVKQQLQGPNLQASAKLTAILQLSDPTAPLLPQPASIKISPHYNESFKY